MIRVNLLIVEKPAPRRFILGLHGKGGALVAAVVLLGAVACVTWDFLQVHRDHWRLDAEIASAELEQHRLEPILREVARFDARKRELQQRVRLIEDLRRNQAGAVHLLDQISRSLPDRLWLTDLKQTDNDVVMSGRTSSLTALADFVGNLDASGYFKRPVEILSSEAGTHDEHDLITFSIKATFVMPGAPPRPVTAGGAGRDRATRGLRLDRRPDREAN